MLDDCGANFKIWFGSEKQSSKNAIFQLFTNNQKYQINIILI